jgi:predicted O-linked N-acetylglucosamine transferase (SPINDLY family)
MTVNERLSVDRPAKIQGHHVDRWAIVYVRQSHPQQVLRHRESAQVQANLKDRAAAWGWPAERIRVLDGDQMPDTGRRVCHSIWQAGADTLPHRDGPGPRLQRSPWPPGKRQPRPLVFLIPS